MAAAWLFWFALGSGVMTAIVWSLLGSPDVAVIRTIAVLVIACPHALGPAIPLVVSIATERAAKGGVLVKDRLALESVRTVDTVLFDKTGTLTKGDPTLAAVHTSGEVSEEPLLAVAAAVEADSEHPLSRAIVAAATARGVSVPKATGFQASTAVGVTATVEGAAVSVGGSSMLAAHQAAALEQTRAWEAEGTIILHVLRDGKVLGALGLADEVREESRHAVDALHAIGVQVVMITGDAEAVARTIADEFGSVECV